MATNPRAPSAATITTDESDAGLLAAVLPGEAASAWWNERPQASGEYRRDIAAFGTSWQQGGALLAALPKKPARTAAHEHAETLYRALAKHFTAFRRAGEFVDGPAPGAHGLVPSREQVARESVLVQRD